MIRVQVEIAVAVVGDVVAEKAAPILQMHKMRVQQHKKMKIQKNQLHIAVAAVVISAVEQALSPLNVRINEFPLSPMRLLELIDQATQPTQ